MSGRKEQLQALLERVEKAEGPSGYLDFIIWETLTPDTPLLDKWVAPLLEMSEDDVANWATRFTDIQPYTASIDAAVALVEKVLPDVYFDLSGPRTYLNIPTPVPNYWRLQLMHDKWGFMSEGWGTTAPLAICAALLKALIAGERIGSPSQEQTAIEQNKNLPPEAVEP